MGLDSRYALAELGWALGALEVLLLATIAIRLRRLILWGEPPPESDFDFRFGRPELVYGLWLAIWIYAPCLPLEFSSKGPDQAASVVHQSPGYHRGQNQSGARGLPQGGGVLSVFDDMTRLPEMIRTA